MYVNIALVRAIDHVGPKERRMDLVPGTPLTLTSGLALVRDGGPAAAPSFAHDPSAINSTDTIASLRRARKPCLSETEDQKKQVASHEDVTHHRHRGAGTLGDAPWSAAGALYWAEVDLEAPATEGSYEWNVKLPKPDLELAHEGSAYPFAFVTASPPDHVVTVEVIDKDSKTPLSKAFVTLHSSGGFPYRNRTDDAGVARVSVPKGEYRVYVLKEDYKDSQTTAAIASDVTIKAELLFAPDPGG
jgi:hypothetical protein